MQVYLGDMEEVNSCGKRCLCIDKTAFKNINHSI